MRASRSTPPRPSSARSESMVTGAGGGGAATGPTCALSADARGMSGRYANRVLIVVRELMPWFGRNDEANAAATDVSRQESTAFLNAQSAKRRGSGSIGPKV